MSLVPKPIPEVLAFVTRHAPFLANTIVKEGHTIYGIGCFVYAGDFDPSIVEPGPGGSTPVCMAFAIGKEACDLLSNAVDKSVAESSPENFTAYKRDLTEPGDHDDQT